MFFNIDADEGGSIRGWLALDNPSAIPSLIVVIPHREEIQFEANVMRGDIKELGIHNTGQVGFEIDQRLVEGLDRIDDITIVEAESRLPIFRRFQMDRHIEKKLFLFDGSTIPQRAINRELSKQFTLLYFNSERLSLETMLVIINNHFTQSIAISGRSNFNRYAPFLNNAGYIRAALLRDPFEELAERLLFLKLLGKSDLANLIGMYTRGFESLLELARDLPLNDQKAMTAAFRSITDAQREAIKSPMTRILGCNIGESPEHRHVPIALENLATMDVVGTRALFGPFKELLAGILGANIFGDEVPTCFPSISHLAASLSRIGVIADLLEHDRALYSYVEQSIDIGLAGSEAPSKRETQAI
ncbi:MAG: hypothetical protein ACLPIC_11225 [Rhodoblastus sp.]|uniref:hypothetical protein n=1 Tax=Rhodoblastus sp. TaxID=1962975 RepID=UPI003F99691B